MEEEEKNNEFVELSEEKVVPPSWKSDVIPLDEPELVVTHDSKEFTPIVPTLTTDQQL